MPQSTRRRTAAELVIPDLVASELRLVKLAR